jgi:hypothetical protein
MKFSSLSFFAIATAMVWLILPACRKECLLLEEDPDAIGQFCRIDTQGDDGFNLFFYIQIQNLGISYSCDQPAGQSTDYSR